MALATGAVPKLGGIDSITAYLVRLFDRQKARAARRRLFRQTYRELSALDDKDLADLGLHRSAIASVAREAASMMG